MIAVVAQSLAQLNELPDNGETQLILQLVSQFVETGEQLVDGHDAIDAHDAIDGHETVEAHDTVVPVLKKLMHPRFAQIMGETPP